MLLCSWVHLTCAYAVLARLHVTENSLSGPQAASTSKAMHVMKAEYKYDLMARNIVSKGPCISVDDVVQAMPYCLAQSNAGRYILDEFKIHLQFPRA